MAAPPKNTIDGAPAEGCGNEGGRQEAADIAAQLGIVTHLAETYSVGGFRYTNLMHAIAEARRLRVSGGGGA